MKLKNILIVLTLALSLISCSDNSNEIISTETASSSVNSTESVSESEISEEKEESWTETTSRNIGYDKEVVIIDYFDFGENWIKNTQTFDENNVLRQELIRTVIDNEIVKSVDLVYDENGELIRKVSKEFDGEITKMYYDDTLFSSSPSVRLIDEVIMITKSEIVISEKSKYLDPEDEHILAEHEKKLENINDEEYIIEDYVLYSNRNIACKVSKRKTSDETINTEIMYDADGNEVCYFSQNKNTNENIIRYPTDNGYLQADIAKDSYTLYEIKNDKKSEWFAKISLDENGNPAKAVGNTDHYTTDEINALLQEWSALDASKMEILNNLDYIPIGF